jgi:hypothetical protein
LIAKSEEVDMPKLRIKDGKFSVSKMVTIFLEEQEALEDIKDTQRLNDLYDRKLKKTHAQKPLPSKILEPVPTEEHLLCTLCKL